MVSRLAFGKAASFSSISLLQPLNSLIHTPNLPPSLMSSSLPLSHSRSPGAKLSSVLEVVVDRRSSWSSVTEREELVGRISAVSRLPQYLWSALPISLKHPEGALSRRDSRPSAQKLARDLLDARNVNRRRHCSFVDHRAGCSSRRCKTMQSRREKQEGKEWGE